MKSAYIKQLDYVCSPDDVVEVEVQSRPSGHVLYVHVNDVTVARICRIGTKIRVTDHSTTPEGPRFK